MIVKLTAGKIKDNNYGTDLFSLLKNSSSTSKKSLEQELGQTSLFAVSCCFFQFQLMHKQNRVENLIKIKY